MSTSPADVVQDTILQAHWAAYEEDRQTFLEARYASSKKAGTICGTIQSYRKGCRCDLCRWAYNEYHREYKLNSGITQSHRARVGTNFTHGTRYGYRIGCRCVPCVERNRENTRQYNARKRGRMMIEQESRTGKYPVIETEQSETKELKRPVETLEERSRLEEIG